MFTYTPSQPIEGNKVRIAWDTELENDYFNQQMSLYKRALGIADGCEHVSSIANSVARKSQGTNEVGKLIIDGMKIGGHIANGLGYGKTRADLLQLRQEIERRFILRDYYTPSELQQKAEIDRQIDECQEKSNKNFFLGTVMSACLFGVSLYTYGDEPYILNEFHANLGTFHWGGSLLPLYEKRRRCFENLRNHPNLSSRVKEWIQKCLIANQSDYDREAQNEAFRRMAYNKP